MSHYSLSRGLRGLGVSGASSCPERAKKDTTFAGSQALKARPIELDFHVIDLN